MASPPTKLTFYVTRAPPPDAFKRKDKDGSVAVSVSVGVGDLVVHDGPLPLGQTRVTVRRLRPKPLCVGVIDVDALQKGSAIARPFMAPAAAAAATQTQTQTQANAATTRSESEDDAKRRGRAASVNANVPQPSAPGVAVVGVPSNAPARPAPSAPPAPAPAPVPTHAPAPAPASAPPTNAIRRVFRETTPVDRNVAYERGECGLCYGKLYSSPVAVMVAGARRRVCKHYVHVVCAQRLMDLFHVHACPICSTPFSEVVELPNVMLQLDAFWAVVDSNGDGRLSRDELLDVLRATFDVGDLEALAAEVDAKWSAWDASNKGYLTKDDLRRRAADGGTFADWLVQKWPTDRLFRMGSSTEPTPPPLSESTAAEWFRFYDADGSNTLTGDEIFRGVVKTFRLETKPELMRRAWDIVMQTMAMYDADGSGAIDLDEWSGPDGLAKALVGVLSSAP